MQNVSFGFSEVNKYIQGGWSYEEQLTSNLVVDLDVVEGLAANGAAIGLDGPRLEA